jgi:hypothetical protein
MSKPATSMPKWLRNPRQQNPWFESVAVARRMPSRAGMIGRAYLLGLAANGEAGVENVLDILRSGIDSALLGMGLSSIHELREDQLLIPDDFHRAVGATAAADHFV